MRDLSPIKTARSRKLHVTASSIQSHLWYRDEHVATLCGQWLQVRDRHTDVNIDDVTGPDGSLYTNCHGRYLQSVRNVIRPGFSGGSRV